MNILHLDSSARGNDSATRALSAAAVANLRERHPGASVVYRDLTVDPLPHIGPEFLAGIFAGGEFANHATVKLSDTLLAELFAADVIVIGAPMYNFSIPSQLKAWIDYVLRAGKTFQYGEQGPKGLVTGKRAVVAIASGGVYTEGFMVPFDHVGPLLKQVLGFMGIIDCTIVRAEGQSMGPDAAKQSLDKAKQTITSDAKAMA